MPSSGLQVYIQQNTVFVINNNNKKNLVGKIQHTGIVLDGELAFGIVLLTDLDVLGYGN